MGFENGTIARCVFRASTGQVGQEEVLTLHYDLAGNGLDPAPTLQDLADRLRDDVLPAYKALFINAWTIDPVVVIDEFDPQNPTKPRTGVTSGTSGLGTRTAPAGQQLAPAICTIVNLKTGLIGRRFRGRMFVGGSCYESDANGSTWETPVASNMAYLVAALVTAIPHEPDIVGGASTATADWCVYSRTQRAADLDPYAPHVTATIQDTQVRWLRSRQPGR